MKKQLTMFLIGGGLVLTAAAPTLAQGVNLFPRSGMAIRSFNSAFGPANLMVGPAGSSYPALLAKQEDRDATTTSLETGLAVVAGGLTLVLLQRRDHGSRGFRTRL